VSAFDGLRRFFRPSDTTVALPADPFVGLDRQRAINNLKLDERAKLNGASNFPAPDQAEFDDVERHIITEISEQARRAQIDAATNHRVYGERLSELALLRELSTITAESHRALGDYRATIINRRGRLALTKDSIRESYQELAAFKREHRLNRPAHEGIPEVVAWSAFIFAWFVESALNTLFLRVNDPLGILGGFMAAAIIAAVNVGTSALVGRLLLPNLFHKGALRRRFAQVACLVWVALLFAWNLLAAHFRDAKADSLPNPDRVALELFVNTPFHLDTIYSYGLLIGGIAFAGISALAAYKMEDPYPGYGAINNRHKDRCNAYSDQIESILGELRATRDQAIESASAIRDELQLQFRERGQIIVTRDSHRNRYREHQDYLEAIGNDLLTYYRSANVRARTDGRVPLCFNKQWHLARNELPRDPDEPGIEAEVARAEQELRKSTDTINEAYMEAIESFDNLDEIKRSLENV
jgi:hypothetical protein